MRSGNTLIDPVTGELHDVRKRPGVHFGRRFVTMFEDGLRSLMTTPDLQVTDYRVFATMLLRLGHVNYAEVNQVALGHGLGVTQSAISRSTKRLHAADFLEREDIGQWTRASKWRLNTLHSYRGGGAGR